MESRTSTRFQAFLHGAFEALIAHGAALFAFASLDRVWHFFGHIVVALAVHALDVLFR